MKQVITLTALLGATAWTSTHAIVPDPMTLSQPGAGWSGNIYSDLSKTGGNVDLLTWAAGGQVQHRTMFADSKSDVQRAYRLRAEHYQGQVSDTSFANQFFGLLDAAYMLHPKYGLFLFIQLETNDFQALTRRTTAGPGAFASLLSGENWQAWASLAPMIEEEENVIEGSQLVGRGATSLSLQWTSTDRQMGLLNSIYFQPKLFQSTDYRLLYYAEMQIAVNKKLSFHLIGQLHYDHRPPAGIKKTDTSIRNRLSYRFGN